MTHAEPYWKDRRLLKVTARSRLESNTKTVQDVFFDVIERLLSGGGGMDRCGPPPCRGGHGNLAARPTRARSGSPASIPSRSRPGSRSHWLSPCLPSLTAFPISLRPNGERPPWRAAPRPSAVRGGKFGGVRSLSPDQQSPQPPRIRMESPLPCKHNMMLRKS